ncbi:hypothetical protein VPH35_000640 [Triticum aestivum]
MQRAGKDTETTPLSGDRPFFTAFMCKTHVQKPYLLIIPAHFQRMLPERRMAVVLRCGVSSWIMSYYGHTKLKNLDADWADFAVDKRPQVEDACVFELVSWDAEDDGKGEVVLEVHVLRRATRKARGFSMVLTYPEVEDLATKGDTTDEPIVIMDKSSLDVSES